MLILYIIIKVYLSIKKLINSVIYIILLLVYQVSYENKIFI